MSALPPDAGQDVLTMLGAEAGPPSITFSPGGKTVLTITPDGRFVLGDGATVDDAANAICEIASRIMRPPFTREDVALLTTRPIRIAGPQEACYRCGALPPNGDEFYYHDKLRELATRIATLLPPETSP